MSQVINPSGGGSANIETVNNPVALGAASHGSGTTASAWDHVHPTTGLALVGSANTFTTGTQTIQGALVVSGGNFQVDSSGRVALSTSIVSSSMLTILAGTAHPSATTIASGIVVQPVYGSSVTSTGQVIYGQTYTTAAAFTLATSYVFLAASPSVGAGSAITTQYGVEIFNQGASGITNAYGIDVNAQSGAATLNVAARLSGGTQANLWLNSDTASAAGGLVFGTARDVTLFRAGASQLTIDGGSSTGGTILTLTQQDNAMLSITTTSNSSSLQLSHSGGIGIINDTYLNYLSLRINGQEKARAVYNAGFSMIASASTIVPTIVQGASSQTADLQRWQDTAGTIVSGIRAPGQSPTTPVATTASADMYLTSGRAMGIDVGPYLAFQGAYNSGGSISPFAVVGGFKETAGDPNQRGYFGVYTAGVAFGLRLKVSSEGATTISVGSVGSVPITAVGFTGQTANLQEWNVAGGSAVVSIDPKGRVGMGGSPVVTDRIVNAQAAHPGTATQLYGHVLGPNVPATTTAGYTGYWAQLVTAASAFTLTSGYLFYGSGPSLGAGSAITNQAAFVASNQGASGVTNAFGFWAQAQSGAATLNIAARLSGGTQANLWLDSDTASAAGGISFGASRDTSLFRASSGVVQTAGFTITGALAHTGSTVGFYSATPTAQIAGSTDVLAGLVTQGLRAASSNPPLNLGTGAITAGTITGTTTINVAISGVTGYRIGNNTGATNTGAWQTGSTPTSTELLFGTDGTGWQMRFGKNQGGVTTHFIGLIDTGHLLWIADNSYDIGQSGATRPRNVYAGTSVVAPTGTFATAISTGSLTVTGGNFRVDSAGRAATLGSAIFTDYGFVVGGNHPSSGVALVGFQSSTSFPATTTTQGAAGIFVLVTAASAFTMGTGFALVAGAPVLGAGSAVTTAIGLDVQNQGSAAVTTAYGINIEAQSGATVNVAAVLGGGTTANLWLASDTASIAGGIAFGTTRDTNFFRGAAGALQTSGVMLVGSTATPSTVNLLQLGRAVNHVSAATTISGLAVDYVAPSTATAASYVLYAMIRTAAASFTLTEADGLFVDVVTRGASSTITTASGVKVANQGATGVTNAYGLRILAQSGAATLNIAAELDGGTTANLWLNSDTASVAGGIAFGTARDVSLFRASSGSLQITSQLGVGVAPIQPLQVSGRIYASSNIGVNASDISNMDNTSAILLSTTGTVNFGVFGGLLQRAATGLIIQSNLPVAPGNVALDLYNGQPLSSGETLFRVRDSNTTKLAITGAGDFTLTGSAVSFVQTTVGTGTVQTAGTTALVGTLTRFTETFAVGDTITVSGETIRTIATITDNTHLTVTVAFSTSASGLSYTQAGSSPFSVTGAGSMYLSSAAASAAVFTIDGGSSHSDQYLKMKIYGSGADAAYGLIYGNYGLDLGTVTTQNLIRMTGSSIGFFTATPVTQQSGSTDVLASLVNLGLRAASSNPPLNLGSGTITAGTASFSATATAVQVNAGTDGVGSVGLVRSGSGSASGAGDRFEMAVPGSFSWIIKTGTVVSNGDSFQIWGGNAKRFEIRSGGETGFFGVSAVAQPAGTTDVLASLVTLGLRAASSNPPLDLGTGTLSAGAGNFSSTVAVTGGGVNISGGSFQSTAGNFQVRSTGALGIGSSASNTYMINLQATHPGTVATIYGVATNYTIPNNAPTTAHYSFFASANTAAVAFTLGSNYGFYADVASIGAGSSITTNVGLGSANRGTAGVTTAIGLEIAAQSGATTNIAARLSGGTQANLHLNSDTASAAGGINFGATLAAGQSMYRQASNVIEAGGTFSAVTGFQVNHVASTAGHVLRSDGTRFVDAAIAAGDLPTSGIPNVAYVNVGNTFTTGTNTFQGSGISVTAGSLQVSAGSFQVDSSGRIGVGAAIATTTQAVIGGTSPSGNTFAYGLRVDPTFTTVQTVSGLVFEATFATAASVTMTTGGVMQISAPSLGATPAITTLTGLYVANQGATGVTNAIGIDMEAFAGAATLNVGVRLAGGTQANLHLKSNTATEAGGIAFGTTIDTSLSRNAAGYLQIGGAAAANAAIIATDTAIADGQSVHHRSGAPGGMEWMDSVGAQTKMWTRKDPGAATMTTVGTAAPTLTATASSTDGTDGPWLTSATTTTSGNPSGIISAFTVCQTSWLPEITLRVKTDASIALLRLWFGLFSASPDASATPAIHLAAFRYDTTADGTVFWRTCTDNGSGAPTVTTTTTAIAASTVYLLRIAFRQSDGAALFYINGVLVATHTTKLPTTTTGMGYGSRVTTLTTAAKKILTSRIALSYV